MSEISISHIIKSYEVGRAYHKKEIGRTEGIKILIELGMSKGSASRSIYDYTHFVRGTVFKSTKNAEATDYYLNRIFEEDGITTLKKAVSALEQHIHYYENLYGGNVVSKKAILDKYKAILDNSNLEFISPEEMLSDIYIEGGMKRIFVNSYERDRKARNRCLEIHGYSCAICTFNFEEQYGLIGSKFIHVHHIVEISSISKKYEVNPEKDLIPVCPNCHAMLHKRKPAYTVSELKEIIRDRFQTSI